MAKTGPFEWWVPEHVTLRSRTWGEDTVVYNEASGDTHLVGPVDAAVLDRLQKSPANIPELVDHVVESLGIDEQDELYFYVDELMDKLEKLELVEHVRR